MVTRTIAAGEFKAKCLALLDEVAETGEELVITKRGKPVARVAPLARTARRTRFRGSALAHHVLWTGDIVSPVEGYEWDASANPVGPVT